MSFEEVVGKEDIEEICRSRHQARVAEFMEAVGQKVRHFPTTDVEDDERILRAKLILEEALETVEAMGVRVVLEGDRPLTRHTPMDVSVQAPHQYLDLAAIADGCGDLSVVTVGTMLTFGIADRLVLAEIDHSNIAKIKGGYRREDGKWMKPEGWEPPSIAKVLHFLKVVASGFMYQVKNLTPVSEVDGGDEHVVSGP